MNSPFQERLIQFSKISISTIEEFEQQFEAFKNQQVDEAEFNCLKKDYERLLSDYVEIKGHAGIVEAERNTLNQALRIFCSGGKIDPAQETKDMQLRLLLDATNDNKV
jgi:two-component SAPR family response regulator